MGRCLVVGGGFIGRAVAAALGPDGRLVDHRAVAEAPELLDGVRAVLYAGRHPALGTPAWRLEDDLEPRLARRVAEAGLPFVSLGTRKVYAPAHAPLAETSPLGPGDLYGRQKLEIEEALVAISGSRLTRLRLSNIFGFEPDRRSFMGLMLTRLRDEGAIRFDMSPFTARDFLPVEVAAVGDRGPSPSPGGRGREHRVRHSPADGPPRPLADGGIRQRHARDRAASRARSRSFSRTERMRELTRRQLQPGPDAPSLPRARAPSARALRLGGRRWQQPLRLIQADRQGTPEARLPGGSGRESPGDRCRRKAPWSLSPWQRRRGLPGADCSGLP